MKNILKQLNQRPIAYYPIYRQITGSTTAGILLSQIMYWFKNKDKFFKTDKDIIDETLLTKKELENSKKALKKLPFLTIKREGLPAKTYYEIDWDLYINYLQNYNNSNSPKGENKYPPKGETIHPQTGEHYSPKGGNTTPPIGETASYYIYKTTTETTSEIGEVMKNFFEWLKKISKNSLSQRDKFEAVFYQLFTSYKAEEIKQVIEWAMKDNFWFDKLTDPNSIKRNFDKMRLQMQKSQNHQNQKKDVVEANKSEAQRAIEMFNSLNKE